MVIISTSAGMIPDPMLVVTASPAWRGESKSAASVAAASGLRSSRSVILVAMPSVPSEPTAATWPRTPAIEQTIWLEGSGA